jgi:hypothetical protein
MRELEVIIHVIMKLFIIINATKLGWAVDIYNDRLILTKKSNFLTKLDKNTPKLMSSLMTETFF